MIAFILLLNLLLCFFVTQKLNEAFKLSIGFPAGGTYHSVPAFQGGNPGYMEDGSGPKMDLNFNDQSIRAGFIRKVFILVTLMLAVVAVMTAVPFLHQPTMTFVRSSPGIYWLSYGTFLVVYIALMCCESVRRSSPSNLICTVSSKRELVIFKLIDIVLGHFDTVYRIHDGYDQRFLRLGVRFDLSHYHHRLLRR